MEDRMDAASTERSIIEGRSAVDAQAGPARAAGRPLGPDGPGMLEEPGPAAVPLLRLTPVLERPAGRPSSGAARAAVTGAAVLVITAGLGRRAGAPARLTALCSMGACGVVVGPWLASRLVPRPTAR